MNNPCLLLLLLLLLLFRFRQHSRGQTEEDKRQRSRVLLMRAMLVKGHLRLQAVNQAVGVARSSGHADVPEFLAAARCLEELKRIVRHTLAERDQADMEAREMERREREKRERDEEGDGEGDGDIEGAEGGEGEEEDADSHPKMLHHPSQRIYEWSEPDAVGQSASRGTFKVKERDHSLRSALHDGVM